MPIPEQHVPAQPTPAAIEANRRGVLLRSQGRLAEAAQAFREGIAAQPALPLLHANLATALAESGDLESARHAYEAALRRDPDLVPALTGLGALHVRLGRFAEARAFYERALQRAPDDIAAHWAMYELEQIDGNLERALFHQRCVLQRKTLFSRHAPEEQRRVLALMVPGDWQANVPIDFLIDARTTTLHKLYILSADRLDAQALPRADVIFTAIGEADEHTQALDAAAELIAHSGLPYVNDPRKVAAANRANVARILARVPHVHAPETLRVHRDSLRRGGEPDYPLVVRPVGSQAGRDLARIDAAEEWDSYLQRVSAPEFYVMPFVDFRSSDGFYRKYRIIVVDGEPYPFHEAISPRWMIHYYNAPMRELQWMRDEEAAFLRDFDRVFSAPLRQALREVARVLGLEYLGIDCSIDAQGRLLVFEADPAMVVHAGDDAELFGYKIPYAQRIFDAFAALIDRARSR